MEDPLVQVVIPGISSDLLDKIDRIAKKEDRSRSAMIRVLLKERVEELVEKTETRELAAA